MYWDQFVAQWDEQKHRIRKRWDRLSEEDLQEIHGKWERLVAKIMARYGLTIQTAERQILAFLHSHEVGETKRPARHKTAHHS